jgi:undecaprenyl diphosphate synthase
VIGEQAPTPLPDMVIFIMDGNGRYAEKHGKPKPWGHLQGVFKAREMMNAMKARGIRKLGFWAASTDNFEKRVKKEMQFLANLIKRELREFLKNPQEVRIRICGDWRKYVQDDELEQLIAEVEESTSMYSYLELTIFFGFGGRSDIIHAVKDCVHDFVANQRPVEDIERCITPDYLEARLLSHWVKGDKLLVFRSGEESPSLGHTSDFLLWQLRSAEWKFSTTLWPELSVAEVEAALEEYGARSRLQGAPRR